ncbi:hypothetical protein Lpp126_02267, partial [Lacticaseibacillus paracasei subsp. paracasei Lpp126]
YNVQINAIAPGYIKTETPHRFARTKRVTMKFWNEFQLVIGQNLTN